MRDYVMGNFLDGLEKAGVPKGVLWGPKRYVSAGMNGSGVSELSDLLWLPTVWELYENGVDYEYSDSKLAAAGETAENQARLEYYTDSDSCTKSNWYWLASAYAAGASSFCHVNGSGITTNYGASSAGGCAPAFCVQ
jgi:hypothetical protein